MKTYFKAMILLSLFILNCGRNMKENHSITFKDDLEFLQRHTEVIVLKDSNQTAQIIVCPKYQGRVMTSSASGKNGLIVK